MSPWPRPLAQLHAGHAERTSAAAQGTPWAASLSLPLLGERGLWRTVRPGSVPTLIHQPFNPGKSRAPLALGPSEQAW